MSMQDSKKKRDNRKKFIHSFIKKKSITQYSITSKNKTKYNNSSASHNRNQQKL